MPSSCAGPEKTAPWPSTICVSVMPCAKAAPPRASAPAAISTRIMIFPFRIPVRSIIQPRHGGAAGGCAVWLSAGEELPHLLHEALGAGIVAARVLAVDFLELAQELAMAVGQPHRRLDDHLAEEVPGIARA